MSAKSHAGCLLDSLESRRLLAADPAVFASLHRGVLHIRGTETADEIVIASNATSTAAATEVTATLGTETLSFDASLVRGLSVRAGDGNDTVTNNTALRSVMFGGPGDDSLTGGSGRDQLLGGVGNDVLVGNDGQDRLLGEAGDDNLAGGAGRDYVFGGAGTDVITGGSEGDLFVRAEVRNDEVTDFVQDEDRVVRRPMRVGDAMDQAVRPDRPIDLVASTETRNTASSSRL